MIRILAPVTARLGGLLLAGFFATGCSDECSDWTTKAFFESATVKEVEACVNAGADLGPREATLGNGSKVEGGTPLHYAASYSPTPEVIKVLVRVGSDINFVPNYLGGTPLHNAALTNTEPAVINALVEAGADLDAEDHTGRRPLHTAIRSRSLAMAKALLAAGADVDGLDEDGVTPLHEAAFGNHEHPEIIEILISAGANVDARGRREAGLQKENGWTPLHYAARYSAPFVVDALLDAGADPTARDDEGRLPWDLASGNASLRSSATLRRLGEAHSR